MSDRVAAGCARSKFQSVSVVPMSQWCFHGMTNSTEDSVRRIRPASPTIRSRGTTMCTPLDARTRNRPRPPDMAWISSVQTPVQLSTTPARMVAVRPSSVSRTSDPHDAVGLADEPGDLRRRPHHRAVASRGTRDGEGVPGVIGLGVEVPHSTDQRIRPQPREHPQGGAPAEVLLPRHAGVAAHRVVQRQAGGHVRPLPPVVGQRIEERNRLDQVRGQPGRHQLPLAQRLAHQAELELLQIAQAAVEQLGRPARGSGGEVARLDQSHGQPTGGRVERRTGAGDAAADHDDVERFVGQPVPGRFAIGRVEAGRGPALRNRRDLRGFDVHAATLAQPAGRSGSLADMPGKRGADALVAAVDQGTTSTRCLLFDADARIVGRHQLEHGQHFPRPGWVEHDAAEIWANTQAVMTGALEHSGRDIGAVAAVGITNQRETAVVWDRRTGEPIAPAIVWQDTRTQALCDELGARGGGPDRYRDRVGLPLATYFSAPKARWLLDSVDGARSRAERGELAFGTIDSWLLWNLSGGVDGGVHLTDATNASRTLLMELDTLRWAEDIAADIGVPMAMLPEIRSSCEIYADVAAGPFAGVPIAGILGDQQAAMFGQACLEPGEAKNTYGTGNFLLLNTGGQQVRSRQRPADDGGVTPGPARSRCTPSRGRSPSPVRWCSGCATTSGSSAAPTRSRTWPGPSTTTAVPTSCPRSPVCSPRTGARTPAARSSV